MIIIAMKCSRYETLHVTNYVCNENIHVMKSKQTDLYKKMYKYTLISYESIIVNIFILFSYFSFWKIMYRIHALII